VIRSYANKDTEEVSKGRCPKGFPAQLLKTARRKLAMVDAATKLEDLKAPPGNKLHPLTDDRRGQHAIRINDQYRVCFKFRDGDAFDVEVTDYH
jgi:proteic killer suppression protein